MCVYVCVCVDFIYTHTECMHVSCAYSDEGTCTNTNKPVLHKDFHECMHSCAYIPLHIHTYSHTYIHTRIRNTYIHTHTHIDIYTRTQIRARAHTHTYLHRRHMHMQCGARMHMTPFAQMLTHKGHASPELTHVCFIL
jgi:hypothetical protein